MNKLRQFFRVMHINFLIAKNGLDKIFFSTPWLYSLRFLSHLNPWTWIRNNNQTRGQSLRLTLEQLGPVFVKFGQLLSTRRDLIPADIIIELEKLQDQVPAFSQKLVKDILEKTYNQPWHTIFQTFELMPLASASIAQVHAATLHTGEEVIVKIARPNIEKQIKSDIALMYTLTKLLNYIWPMSRRLKLVEMVAEFEYIILNELDLLREAANAAQLKRNFKDSPILYIPEIYWDYAHPNVIVMERIEGIRISDIATLKAHHIDLKKLAENGVEIFFTQVFRDSFFHADMHPGNIFVSPLNPHNPRYIAVDFGIMGSLSPNDMTYLAENLLAFFKRDYRRIAVLHVQSGWVPVNTRIEEFEAAIRSVCEPIFGRSLKDISFAQVLLRLYQTAQQFNMEIQPQLALLQKTLFHVEGLGRTLYPELDLWATAKPYLERWIRQQISPRTLYKKIYAAAPGWIRKLPEIPDLLYRVLQQQSTPTVTLTAPAIPKKNIDIKSFCLGIGTTLLSAAGLCWLFIPQFFDTYHYFTWSVGFLGFACLLWSLLK